MIILDIRNCESVSPPSVQLVNFLLVSSGFYEPGGKQGVSKDVSVSFRFEMLTFEKETCLKVDSPLMLSLNYIRVFNIGRVGHPFFSKECNVLAFFCVLLRSF